MRIILKLNIRTHVYDSSKVLTTSVKSHRKYCGNNPDWFSYLKISMEFDGNKKFKLTIETVRG